ncbi:unnamed protein product [Rotaria sp. Silwood2]|nr:unnamed protein product [Rotaria sp. Silwood2]CAF2683267.1 unnamed protein product [Rotaria sp. Silwood2]CAF3069110.1 unnamed protein product [Rotaria sp. Silwood2]CAF4184591.1 unnamed protein product [Rotaria sp. Silwood2]CAF4207896.1 unnamed protein product [Rotaria sp. Silwood2]
MEIRNIAFQLMTGRTRMTQLDDAFTLQDFIKVIVEKVGKGYSNIVQRMFGGSTIDSLMNRIQAQLPSEMKKKLPKREAECMICMDMEPVITVDYQLKCIVCDKPVNHKKLFVSDSFLSLLNELYNVRRQLDNIDCQRYVMSAAHTPTLHSSDD